MTRTSTYVPVKPIAIAHEGIAAAKAGAAVVHIHVRNPQTGEPSMDLNLYREVVERIRESQTDVLINLTTGMGASYIPPIEDPASADIIVRRPDERIEHVVELRPDICSLDVATMNFDTKPIVNSPDHLRYMARKIDAAGVKPELEVFDLGQVGLALHMLGQGDFPRPAFFQFCLGIRGGAPATPEALLAMKGMVPPGTTWSAFGISRDQFPIAALSVVLGGHVRVGLEDNLFLGPGELSRGNVPLVDRAVKIIESIGADVATPSDARKILSLQPS